MTPKSENPVLPSRDDPLVRAATGATGGPAGNRTAPGAGWWTPIRVLLAMVVLVMTLGVVEKQYCREDAWSKGGTAPYVHACYSDVPHMYRLRGFVEGNLPYFDTGAYDKLEYPVIIGGLMTAAATVARQADGVPRQTILFYDLTVLMLTACAMVSVVVLAKLAGRRPWDAALFALAPALLLNATINWDLVAVMFTALAMLAWARRHPALAGALIGLGAATKLYPVLLLGPLFLLCLRAGRLPAFGKALVSAAAAWAVVNVPVMLLAFDGWKTFYVFSQERGADLGSLWYAASLFGHPVPPDALNTVLTLLLLAVYAGIAVLTLSAPRRPRVAQLVFLAVAAFAVLNKVYSPQYVLWLIPLAALARPRWRDFLIWQACEVVYFFGVWLFLAGWTDANRGLPGTAYAIAIAVHALGTFYFAGMVVRDILDPRHDPVRADGTDDPAGGLLDGAQDAFVLAPRPGARVRHPEAAPSPAS
jgi:uncharacterized membrane protein